MRIEDIQAAATEHRLSRLEAQLAEMLAEVRAIRARTLPTSDHEVTAKAEALTLGDGGIFASHPAFLPMLRARQAERDRREAR